MPSRWMCALVLLGNCLSLFALQARSPARLLPEMDVVAALRPLARTAGPIFRGTVISVTPGAADQAGRVNTVEIRFRVDRSMRGPRKGEIFVLREWAGLWLAGNRYRPGERVFLFLYPESPAGLSSPVGGRRGRFAVDDGGRVVVPSMHTPDGRKKFRSSGSRGMAFQKFARLVREATEE